MVGAIWPRPGYEDPGKWSARHPVQCLVEVVPGSAGEEGVMRR